MAVARYWRQQDQRYSLCGSRCSVCGGFFFPKRTMCPKCHRRSVGMMERYAFKGEGRIISFTIVHEGMPNYSNQVPYVLAMVSLVEGDMVLGQIVDSDPSEIAVDREVELVFRKLAAEGSSGTIQYGYKFRLKQ